MSSYANGTSIGRFALTKANSTLENVSKYQPRSVQTYYESYLQPHLERADALGCRSLDLIEQRFPVVQKSSTQVAENVRGRWTQSREAVTAPAQNAAKEANRRLALVVDNVEATLERYLPSSADENAKSTTTTADAESQNQALRAYRLLNAASTRLGQRVSSQVSLEAATANVQALQATLRESATVYAIAASERLPPSVRERVQVLHTATSERLIALQNQVSAQIAGLSGYVKSSTTTPDWLKARVQSLVDIASKQYELVRSQYSRTDISTLEKTRAVAQGIQDQVLPVLQTLQSQLQYYDPREYLRLNKSPQNAEVPQQQPVAAQ